MFMDKRGAAFSPGRASHERKQRISQALALSSDSDIGRLRPELLGEGRTRVVFELRRDAHTRPDCSLVEKERNRGVLVKVDKGATEAALRDILRTGNLEISQEIREALSRRLVSERFALKSFYQRFRNIALPEKIFLRKIPLSRAAIEEFFPDIALPETFPSSLELPTLVYAQERAPAAAFGSSSHELLFRCTEREASPSDSALFHGNRTFVDLHTSWHDIRQLSGISPEVRKILLTLDQEPGLRDVLRDFCEQSLKYVQDTGEILDLFGADNARLYQDEKGVWHILLIDAYARGRVFAHAQEAIRAASLNYPITDNEALALVSSLNYVRNMNALALAVNASGRFKIFPSDIAPLAQKLLPVMRKALMARK